MNLYEVTYPFIQLPMENNTLYQLALVRIRGIGPVQTKKLISRFGNAEAVFRAGRIALARTGLQPKQVAAIVDFPDFAGAQQQMKQLAHIGARAIFFTDPEYPRRLLDFSNAPPVLYFQGVANLNAAKIIAIAGTRDPTLYGRQVTAQLVQELARPDLVILSGLAYGIDAVAHATAIRCHVPTIGVLGHGFDQMYPVHHRSLYSAMRRHGGLLTSFPHEKKADRYTFPARNWLVAGLCDALIVIESSTVGGSLTTADAATKLGKKIFALPGRISDGKSAGCLQLLNEQRAFPLISADQFKAAIGWDCPGGHLTHQQTLPFTSSHQSKPRQPRTTLRSLTPCTEVGDSSIASPNVTTTSLPDPQHDPLENQLITFLRERQPLSFEEFINLTQQSIPSLSVALLRLEVNGKIRTLPGRRYRLAG